jgi:zeta-carotene desaturase
VAHHVVIVGGGLSGLAAGVDLASHGVDVTILEQKPALGGRAYSFTDSVTGDTIDNGQHVLIAGYDRTMHFLETIGTRQLVHIQDAPRLTFHHPARGFQSLRLPLLPVPFNMLIGFLRCSLFSVADRLRVLRAGFSLQTMNATREDHLGLLTIAEWLTAVGQSREAVRSFWEPLAVSIVNEKIEKASAIPFVRALRTAFLNGSRGAALAIPAVGLSQLYVDSAKQYITRRGGDIHCNADVVDVAMEGRIAKGVRVRDGRSIASEAIIMALPPHKLLPLVPAGLIDRFSYLPFFSSSPIVSVHLWFNETFMEHESVGLIGRNIQWLFNRRMIHREHERGAHVSAVISGAHDFVDLTKDKLVRVAVDDIRSVYPCLREEPWHAVVIREKSATYSSSPDSEMLRPRAGTSVPNLLLAGDWTDTGLPATIEGAVISGERAARLAREYLYGSR